ncbi:hypothetical protein AOLI_G00244140 [Acnodon oligacanthus]
MCILIHFNVVSIRYDIIFCSEWEKTKNNERTAMAEIKKKSWRTYSALITVHANVTRDKITETVHVKALRSENYSSCYPASAEPRAGGRIVSPQKPPNHYVSKGTTAIIITVYARHCIAALEEEEWPGFKTPGRLSPHFHDLQHTHTHYAQLFIRRCSQRLSAEQQAHITLFSAPLL